MRHKICKRTLIDYNSFDPLLPDMREKLLQKVWRRCLEKLLGGGCNGPAAAAATQCNDPENNAPN